MSMFESTLFYTVLSVVSALVMLSIATQILQELYKFLTDSKSRAYLRALGEFIGPLALKLPIVDEGVNLLASGPFQVKRFRTTGKFQPLAKEVLLGRMEQAAPPWIRRALKCLKREAEMQNGKPDNPSPDWLAFLSDLEMGTMHKGTEGYWNAHELEEWLVVWGHERKSANEKSVESKSGAGNVSGLSIKKKISAANMLVSFREKFLPHINAAERNFAQLNTNFEHINRRRNLRLTFLLSLIMILPLDFSITTLFKNAQRMSPQQAMALARTANEMFMQFNAKETPAGEEGSAASKESATAVEPANLNQANEQEGGMPATSITDKDEAEKKDAEKLKDEIASLGKILEELSRTKEIVDEYSKETEWGLKLVDLKQKIVGKIDANVDEIAHQEAVNRKFKETGFWEKLGKLLLYFFQCALTAVAVCFGAPFWNDVAKAMLRRATPGSAHVQS